jgi:hypothetical protein
MMMFRRKLILAVPPTGCSEVKSRRAQAIACTGRRRLSLIVLLAWAAVFAFPVAARAEWPERPVKLIVTFPPGSANVTAPHGSLVNQAFTERWTVSRAGGLAGGVIRIGDSRPP